MSLLLPPRVAASRPVLLPVLRLLGWAVLVVVTVRAGHHPWSRIAAGVLMVLAACALYLSGERQPLAVRRVAVVVASVCGLTAIVLAPSGIAEVPVVLAAAELPLSFSGRALTVATAIDTVAFAAAVGWASRSLGGLLAGIGIPLLVQRAAQRQELRAERDRAQALLAEVQAGREAEAQAAALRERSRIAGEMHDVLAHSLAGLSLHLQAVRAVALRTGASPDLLTPLDTAAQLARDGLAEARAAVATLREPSSLGIDALPALVARHPGTAHLTEAGDPGAVDPPVGHAVYRAVQEALTNAARYAPGARVDVTLDWRPGELRVTVRDSGAATGEEARSDQGTGLGLAGMTDRIGSVGGQVRAGPAQGAGWQVEITVPRAGAS